MPRTIENATILVTGGAGFIGSHTVELLLERGARVINLDALTYVSAHAGRSPASSAANYHFVRGDIGDTSLVSNLFERFRPEVVLNLAAETHVDRSIDDGQLFVNTNIVGLNLLLLASMKYWKRAKPDSFCFVQMSTDEVFGSIKTGVATEESVFAPNSPYAATKAAGDHLVRAFNSTYDLPTMTVRSTNAYGPRQYPEKFIPHMISTGRRGLDMPVYGDGTNVRDWLFVKDLADGIVLALEKGRMREAYNFSAQDEHTNLDVVRRVCHHLDRLCPPAAPHGRLIKFVADRPGHDVRYALSSTKARQELGWEPKTGFEAGLAETAEWYFQNADWTERILSTGYSLRRLGLSTAI